MANQSKMAMSFFIGASANLSQLMSADGLLKVSRRMERKTRLTLSDLKAELGGWPAAKAGGADGWTPRDFKDIPPCLLDWLAEPYGLIEDGAPWPLALTEGVVALVPKKATAGGPLDQRPVTLTNLGYRLWSGCRCRQASTWVRRLSSAWAA